MAIPTRATAAKIESKIMAMYSGLKDSSEDADTPTTATQIPFRVKPGLQIEQIFTSSQVLQLDMGQDTQPSPLVELQDWPARQQPSALLGRWLKVDLQREHLLATSHRSQFKFAGQETQPIPVVELTVKPVIQVAQMSVESQRLQLVGEQETQPIPLVKLQD